MNPELVKYVTEDLEWIRATLATEPPESILRQISGTLRRLLVDGGGLLQRARKLQGQQGEPELLGADLHVALGVLDIPLDGVMLAIAGPYKLARHGSKELSVWIVTDRPFKRPAKVKELTHLPLSQYLAAPGLRLRHPDDAAGRFISRISLLKYIANKLGGVHYDPSRDQKGDEEFEYLDRSILFSTDVDGHPPHYVVLLSITQALVRTPEVMEPFGLIADPL